MFKKIIGKKIKITYFVGGSAPYGTKEVEGYITEIARDPVAGLEMIVLDIL